MVPGPQHPLDGMDLVRLAEHLLGMLEIGLLKVGVLAAPTGRPHRQLFAEALFHGQSPFSGSPGLLHTLTITPSVQEVKQIFQKNFLILVPPPLRRLVRANELP